MNLTPIDALNEQEADQKRALLVKLVRSWGGLNTDAILDSNCLFFFIPAIDGFIGYRVEMNCAVVFGEPICSPTDREKLTEAFRLFCKNNDYLIVYTIVSKDFAHSLLDHKKGVLIQFGSKLMLNPEDNLCKKTGSKAVLIRKKIKHALKEGITVREYLSEDPILEKEIEQVGHSWLASRSGPQVYIAHLNFFNDREGKRWFYAERKGRIIGLLILNEIQEGTGWLLNNLIKTPDAPSGTSELLITSVLEALEVEKASQVIIGPVMGTEIGATAGLGILSSWFLQKIFTALKTLFHLDGQRVFWEKFLPQEEPSYVFFEKINYRTVKALMLSMNVKLSNK